MSLFVDGKARLDGFTELHLLTQLASGKAQV